MYMCLNNYYSLCRRACMYCGWGQQSNVIDNFLFSCMMQTVGAVCDTRMYVCIYIKCMICSYRVCVIEKYSSKFEVKIISIIPYLTTLLLIIYKLW